MAHFRKVMQPRMGLLGAAHHGGMMIHKGRQQDPMSILLSFASRSLKNDPRTITFQTFTLPGNKVTQFPGLHQSDDNSVFSKGDAKEGVVCLYTVFPSATPLTRDLLKFQGGGEDALYGNKRFFNYFELLAPRFSFSNPGFSRGKSFL